MDVMREELEYKDLEGSTVILREKYQKDFENLKVLKYRFFVEQSRGRYFFVFWGVGQVWVGVLGRGFRVWFFLKREMQLYK